MLQLHSNNNTEKKNQRIREQKGRNWKGCVKVNSCIFLQISELYPIFFVGSMGDPQALPAAGAPNLMQTVETR